MLRGENITVRYGRKTALDSVSFRLEEGMWLMLVGPNGAGKTTLLRAIAGSVPSTGDIRLRGEDLRRMSPAERAMTVGFLAQHNAPQYAYTVEEIVRLGRYAHRRNFLSPGDPAGREAVERALAATGMTELRHASVLNLSGGELQRAFLAQVFAQEPDILVLDEPANHLDLKYQRQVFALVTQWLQEPGRAVLSVVHDLSLAIRYGTHALLLDEGRAVADGPVDKVLTDSALRAVYGMDVGAWMRELAEPWQRRPED